MFTDETHRAAAELAALGQSVWLDALRREWLSTGDLARWVAAGGVRGLTSNPSIFRAALEGSAAYDATIARATSEGLDAAAAYDRLTLEDIRAACELLRPTWDASDGRDGWVSHEVDPALADDAAGTRAEAERLWRDIGRPNALIKIPATRAGLPAIRSCLAAGIPINVTLIFAPCQYEAVADAYLAALESRLVGERPLADVASVASVFVSRVDTAVAAALTADGAPEDEARALGEAAALANARRIHRAQRRLFGGPRFARLARFGARPQRLLWASTSAKSADRSPLTYVTPLVGRDTITTLPPATLAALGEHAAPWTAALDAPTGPDGGDDALVRRLCDRGVDLEAVGAALTREGVARFAAAHAAAVDAVAARRPG